MKSRTLPDQTIEQGFGRILRRLQQADQPLDIPNFPNRDYWFEQSVLRDLTSIAEAIATAEIGNDERDFFWVAFSSLVLSKTSVANARDIIHSRHHHYCHETVPDVVARFKTRVARMRRQLAEFDRCCKKAAAVTVRCEVGDARSLDLEDRSVDLIFTSPPYATALDYTRAHSS